MDAITNNGADPKAPHLPCRIRYDPVIIVQHHPKAPVRQDLVDDAFDGKKFLLGHSLFAVRGRHDAALVRMSVVGRKAQADAARPRGNSRSLVVRHKAQPRPKLMNIAVRRNHGKPFVAKRASGKPGYGPCNLMLRRTIASSTSSASPAVFSVSFGCFAGSS